jgi:hypothetical protein
MTYRGQYGSYAKPVFTREAWKDFVSPSSGKKLSELSEDDLKQAVIWSLSHNPDAEAAKAFNEMSKKLYGADGKQNKLD